MPPDPYTQKFGKEGWICSSCGAWVSDGELHKCSKTFNSAPRDIEFRLENRIDNIMIKIADLYSRIDELEKELERLKGSFKTSS